MPPLTKNHSKTIPYSGLSIEQARQATDEAFASYTASPALRDANAKFAWRTAPKVVPAIADVSFQILGMEVQGTFTLTDKTIVFDVKLPFALWVYFPAAAKAVDEEVQTQLKAAREKFATG